MAQTKKKLKKKSKKKSKKNSKTQSKKLAKQKIKEVKSWLLFKNISELLTLGGVVAKSGLRPTEGDLQVIRDACFLVSDGRVQWVGAQKDFTTSLLKKWVGRDSLRTVDLGGGCVLPGFIESHTHLVFAGSRQNELEWRNQGMTYQEIAKNGGGIQKTVEATRSASVKELLLVSQRRVDRFVDQGVTTLEIKSGYGLNLEGEIKQLEVAKKLSGPDVVTTFLGPHSLPKEFKTTDQYLDHLIEKVLPIVAKKKLAMRGDIFIENGFFDQRQGERWRKALENHGLDFVAHVDQLSALGSSLWAATAGSKSVDHAIHVTKTEVEKMAKTGVVAVLLPTADFYLQVDYPNARQMIDSGVPVALATDFNPGTSPCQDLSLVGVLARLKMKMTLPEVLTAYTYNAARALGLQQDHGHLMPGARAHFCVTYQSWRDFFYEVGNHPISSVWKSGYPIKI